MFNDTYLINSFIINEKLPENHVAIPIKAASLWRLPGRAQVKLQYHFFSKHLELIAEPHLSDYEVEMHPALKKQLHLPSGKLQCKYSQTENSLTLGPSIGVVIGDVNEKNTEAPFGPLTSYLTEMAITAETLHCPLSVFSFKDVEGSFVNGYIYENDSWKSTEIPLPQVIYNRIGRRDTERSIHCQAFFDKLTELSIPYFNDQFLHKWETFSMFLKEPTLLPFLPETRPLQSAKDLQYMLKKYNSLYLKPFWGKEGTGIIRIDKENDQYIVTYPKDKAWKTEKEVPAARLFSILKPKLKGKKYLIQQTIEAKKLNGAPIDFRVLCIKDSTSYWRTCSAIGRIGQVEQIVSNLAQGGVQRSAADILKEGMEKEKALHTEKFMHELALHCAQILDAEADGIYGELGFDFMVDSKDNIWILEVNIKPSKGDHSISPARTPPPSIRLLLSFASSLAGFIEN